jgi:hypothetical protein
MGAQRGEGTLLQPLIREVSSLWPRTPTPELSALTMNSFLAFKEKMRFLIEIHYKNCFRSSIWKTQRQVKY